MLAGSIFTKVASPAPQTADLFETVDFLRLVVARFAAVRFAAACFAAVAFPPLLADRLAAVGVLRLATDRLVAVGVLRLAAPPPAAAAARLAARFALIFARPPLVMGKAVAV